MYLKTETRRELEKALGITIRELAAMSADEELSFVEKKIGRRPVFSKAIDPRVSARGSHFLARKRLATMDEIDKKIMGWKVR